MAIRISGNFLPNSFAGTAFSVISPAVPYSSIQPVVYSTASSGIDVVVPQEVGLLEVIAWGSAGGRRSTQNSTATTGTGGTCISYVTVTAGETLSFRIGNTSNNGAGVNATQAGTSSGRGGGYTGVFRGSTPLALAAGGGGNGTSTGANGGCIGGSCGSQTAGGSMSGGNPGGFLFGGNGRAGTSGATPLPASGGGGSGFYGGAGGSNNTQGSAGGGGGSNLCPELPEIDIFPDQSGAWSPGKRLAQAGINNTIPGYIAGRGITSNPGLLIVRWLPLTVDFGL